LRAVRCAPKMLARPPHAFPFLNFFISWACALNGHFLIFGTIVYAGAIGAADIERKQVEARIPKMGISVGASPTVRRCAPRARKCIAGGHFRAEPGPSGSIFVFGGCSCARSPTPCARIWRLPLRSLPAPRSPQVGMMIRMGPDAVEPELRLDGRCTRAGIPKMRSRLVRLPPCSAVLRGPGNSLPGVTLGPSRGRWGQNLSLAAVQAPATLPVVPGLGASCCAPAPRRRSLWVAVGISLALAVTGVGTRPVLTFTGLTARKCDHVGRRERVPHNSDVGKRHRDRIRVGAVVVGPSFSSSSLVRINFGAG